MLFRSREKVTRRGIEGVLCRVGWGNAGSGSPSQHSPNPHASLLQPLPSLLLQEASLALVEYPLPCRASQLLMASYLLSPTRMSHIHLPFALSSQHLNFFELLLFVPSVT